MSEISLRHLNRWTLARQMLLERVELDAVTAIERLGGMQAQHSPSPYIGLWSRLCRFRREELETALMEDRVYKATLMRVTLHLIPSARFHHYRAASPRAVQMYRNTAKLLEELGADVDTLRSEMAAALRERPLTRAEMMGFVRERIGSDLPDWAAWGTAALAGDFIHLPENARFGHFSGGRYRLAPPRETDRIEAFRYVAATYLSAFGPATRADLAQWSGQTVGSFSEALDTLDLVTLRAEDGRTLLDLPDAPRPDPDTPAPIRFLPKWDNLLLAYDRRERVLPEMYRKIVIRKNGDVLPTFLVDGMVAGTWEAPLRGRAVLTLTPLEPIPDESRGAVEEEAERLLAWLRPDTDRREVRWAVR